MYRYIHDTVAVHLKKWKSNWMYVQVFLVRYIS